MLDIAINETDILVTKSGDLVLANTKLTLAKQWVQLRLQTLLGEWFLDTNQGIPWISILSKRDNQTEVDLTIQKTIIGTRYIQEITSYNSVFDKTTGKYSVTFKCIVEGGDVLSFTDLEIT